ncbi:MAG: RDD family protein [Chitinophagales bacterium]|nr:RDD family protein [Chitinophagales bacterium]
MKKISELVEQRFRVKNVYDNTGKLVELKEEYLAKGTINAIGQNQRLIHFGIDMVIIKILLELIFYIFELVGFFPIQVEEETFVVTFLLYLFQSLIYASYYFLFEQLWQKTPGKYFTKTIVVDEYGCKPKIKQMALRSIIRLIPFEAFSCLGDISKGWHDRWTKTSVITNMNFEKIKILQEEQKDMVFYNKKSDT